jgi:hypothetical protein
MFSKYGTKKTRPSNNKSGALWDGFALENADEDALTSHVSATLLSH